MITGLYAGLLGLMLIVLIVRVAMRRLKYKVGLGDGGIADLGQAIRVHGNFIETVPIIISMMAVMEINHAPVWFLHGFGIALLAARATHAYGITSSSFASIGRKYGIFLTMGLILIASIVLIAQAVI